MYQAYYPGHYAITGVREATIGDENMKSSAVPESMARQNPNSPILVDPTKAANQFGLPRNQIDFLQSQILKGTGKVE